MCLSATHPQCHSAAHSFELIYTAKWLFTWHVSLSDSCADLLLELSSLPVCFFISRIFLGAFKLYLFGVCTHGKQMSNLCMETCPSCVLLACLRFLSLEETSVCCFISEWMTFRTQSKFNLSFILLVNWFEQHNSNNSYFYKAFRPTQFGCSLKKKNYQRLIFCQNSKIQMYIISMS